MTEFVESFQTYYDLGANWARENLDDLAPLKMNQIALRERLHKEFQWEGFVESLVHGMPVRVYGLYRKNPDLAENKFVAGALDAVIGNARTA